VQKSADVSSATLPSLRTMVREILRLPVTDEIDGRTLRQLGAVSVQVVALQFRIFKETQVRVSMSELVGDAPVADIAVLIDTRALRRDI
jgi:hypothetical protein